MNTLIRQVKLDELSLVHLLEKQAYENDYYPLFVLRQFYDTQNEYFKVALLENILVGYVIGAIEPNNSTAWILAVATDKNYRNCGIATSLLTDIIDSLKIKGVNSIKLTVSEENKEAIHLYNEKLSFDIETKIQNYYGDNKSRLIMHLKSL